MKPLLHIDDNPDFREGFQAVASSRGMQVESCPDSQHARRFVPLRDYEALIVDNSGFEYCKLVEPFLQSIVVVILSSRPKAADFSADLALLKSDPDWVNKLFAALARKTDKKTVEMPKHLGDSVHHVQHFPFDVPAEPTDVLANLSEDERKELAGQVLVISVTQNRIIFKAKTLLEARHWIKTSPYSSDMCRYMQGPVLVPYTLEELEGS